MVRIGKYALALVVAASGAAGAEPHVSVLDVPLLANARYVLRIEHAYEPKGPAYRVLIERGTYHCLPMLETMAHGYPDPAALAAGEKTCDVWVGVALHEVIRHHGDTVLGVLDAKGNLMVEQYEVLAALGEIDTPAKALLAVWLEHAHDMQWYDDANHLQGSETDGRVRKVAGGFEVEISGEDYGGCKKRGGMGTRATYRLVLPVNAKGELGAPRKVPVATVPRMCP